MVDVLVFGGTGYLGRTVVREAHARGLQVTATHHATPPPDLPAAWETVDVRERPAVEEIVFRLRPRLIVNAAYVMSGPDLVAVTGSAPVTMAAAARRVGSRMAHVSTDLVFDGTAPRPYTEADAPNPLLQYGQVKLDSERGVAIAHPDALVVRTSLLYGGVEPGPQEDLVRRAAAGADIRFFVDEIRSPIRVGDLAAGILDLSLTRTVVGLWHLAGERALNRLSFARRLALTLGIDPDVLRGGEVDDSLGPRPRNCALDSGLAHQLLRNIDPGREP